MFDQFCQGHNYTEYRCDTIEYDESMNNGMVVIKTGRKNESVNIEEFKLLWRDFVSIRINLVETQLFPLLKKLGCKDKDINLFKQCFKFCRNQCVLLPNGTIPGRVPNETLLKNMENNFELYSKLFTVLNEKDNKSGKLILNYFLMYIGFFRLINGNKGGIGEEFLDEAINILVWKRYKQQTKGEDLPGRDLSDRLQFREFVVDYIIRACCATTVFGAFFTSVQCDQDKSKGEANDKIVDICKNALFGGNNLHSFEHLIDDCMCDVSDHIYEYLKQHETLPSKTKKYGGIACFIINRLAYYAFHDLVSTVWSNEIERDELVDLRIQVKYPQLIKFFKFVYNFGIWNHCYAWNIGTEAFYINQYWDWKSSIFQNIFDDHINSNNNNINRFSADLKQFNFSSWSRNNDGTLLHRAGRCNFCQYFKILLLDGFDPSVINRGGLSVEEVANWNANHAIVSILRDSTREKTKTTQNDFTSKTLIKASEHFTQQIMFAKYFLTIIGKHELNNKRLKNFVCESLKDESGDVVKDGLMTDYLFRNFSHFNGLKENGNCINVNSDDLMKSIITILTILLKNKLVIEDDFLILCFEYCKWVESQSQSQSISNNGDIDINSKSSNYNHSLMDQFVESLLSCVKSCLYTNIRDVAEDDDEEEKDNDNKHDDDIDEDKNEDDGTLPKMRNYLYFKEYLLFSNIWLCKDDCNSQLLFDSVAQFAHQQLLIQKQFIWKCINKNKKTEKDKWDNLCDFGANFECNKKYKDDELRQDKIKDGIVPPRNEKELYLICVNRDKNSNEKSSYDVFFEHNNNIYLTQCLTFSHEHNGSFQNTIKNCFKLDKNATFQRGVVKKRDRCIIKANTDYSNSRYPSVSKILDFLRCSITYVNVESMLIGLNKFVNQIKNGEIDNIQEILRVKNGFSATGQWKSFDDAQYCDIKLNVLYRSKSGIGMIVEIQFLLNSLLKAKKLGHKYYATARRDLFVKNVSTIVYDNDNDYGKYKQKLISIIGNNDVSQFAHEMILKPNIIFCMFVPYKEWTFDTPGDAPMILYAGSCVYKNGVKLFSLFLDCLIHYSRNLIGDDLENCESDSFLSRYLNYYITYNRSTLNPERLVKFLLINIFCVRS